jgi:TPP-dependent trihydroxycyclohexane-1,2-dione (THcHDO) dehydratase
MANSTLRLTTAQAIIKYLANRFVVVDGREMRLCGGGFGIFGHGSVTCLGEALYDLRDALPLYRGQNEQSMGFAAAGYAKQWLRQRFMFCTASAGPGFAVINKLQNNTGNQSFNNLIADSPAVPAPFAVDFEAHARAMGANAETVSNATELGAAWWEVGTPHTSNDPLVAEKHIDIESGRANQRKGV